jgi:hypothetical protein
VRAAVKNAVSVASRPGSGPPAPDDPPRTPGSTTNGELAEAVCAAAGSEDARTETAANPASIAVASVSKRARIVILRMEIIPPLHATSSRSANYALMNMWRHLLLMCDLFLSFINTIVCVAKIIAHLEKL